MQFRNLFHIPCHGMEADITGNSHGYPASPHPLVTSDKIRRTPEQPVDFKRSWGHPFPKNHKKQRRARRRKAIPLQASPKQTCNETKYTNS